MPLAGFLELHAAADARQARVPVAAAGAADATVLQSLARAQARGWVAPILVGSAGAIRETARAADVDLAGMRIVDTVEIGAAAVAEVRSGRAAMLMKGQIDTPALLHAVLDAHLGLRTGRTIGQIVLMEFVDQRRRLLLADTGITISPTLAQKVDLVHSVVWAARQLGSRQPKVALVGASEKATAALPDTLESAELQKRGDAGEFGDAAVEGPLSFDLAYAADAGTKKRLAGRVIGAAEAMVFPSLAAANLTVKAMMYTAPSRFGGFLCGAGCPIAFMSRADTAATRLNSLALALQMTVPPGEPGASVG